MVKRTVRPTRLSAQRFISIEEVCGLTGAEETFIHALVAEGIVEEVREVGGAVQLRETTIVRISKAVSLHQDLGINLPGIALALDLLAELKRL